MVYLVKWIIVNFWQTTTEMSPYLLFGFFVAGILAVLIPKSVVTRHLGGRGVWPILKAAIFGIPLPLCSCSVIPVSMSLRKHGASKAATVAFLLATPQTGVDSIFVTYSLLGPIFAVIRPLAALVTGIVGGVLVDIFDNKTGNDKVQPESCSDECCGGGKFSHRFLTGMRHGFVVLPRDIGKPLLLGLVIAAAISAIVPDGFFADKLGTGIFAMFIMMLIGIPMYVCATASVPLAAAFIMKGLTPGAALVFLMTGPATNAASIITIWKIMGRRIAIIYLISVVGSAFVFGVFLDLIVRTVNVKDVCGNHWMIPPIIGYISAVVLIFVLGYATLSRRKISG
jgi:uncharacterized membrane protein YraQ (UPF0718 family)